MREPLSGSRFSYYQLAAEKDSERNMAEGPKKSIFKINLKENGLHSLWRGIESYQEYTRTQGRWRLKEAIIFIHHGIELLMKEMLVQHSEYLIFDDIGPDTVKKQKQATSEGIGIFYLPKPPKTVAYMDAISRVEAFIQPPELDEPLVTRLYELNQLRNQLEHYAIEADAEQVVRLLGSIREPLLNLFEAQIGGIKKEEPTKVYRTWTDMESLAHEGLLREREVAELVQHFRGQEVPGYLFNLEGNIILPIFRSVECGVRPDKPRWSEIDIFAETDSDPWVIEVKTGRTLKMHGLYQVAAVSSALGRTTPWLVFFGELHQNIRQQAKDLGVLLTGIQEWQELERLVYETRLDKSDE
jgi:hypothetical protein